MLNERTVGRVLPHQTTIYHQGDHFEGFFRVNSGVVMLYRLLEDSQRQIIGFFTVGQYFGFPGQNEHNETAVTVATSNIESLPMTLVRRSPELQSDLFYASCDQLNAAQSLITTLTKKTASQKVAAFLVELAEKQSADQEVVDIKLPMSRLDIADYLGLTIETVSRRLTALKSAGIIKLPNRHSAKICNFEALHQLAGAQ